MKFIKINKSDCKCKKHNPKKIIKKKSIVLLSLIYLYSLNNELKTNIFNMAENIEKNITKIFFNSTTIKKKLLDYLSKCLSKNITKIKNIFLGQDMRFGNQLILIQRVIFYCEILGCKNIILDKKNNWFIKNTIFIRKYNMSIKVDEEKNMKYYNDVIIDKTLNFFYYKSLIIPENRINILKNEILNNLPAISIDKNDLFIYIRSGDIFNNNPHPGYIQPPLCYYKKILDNMIFHKIYLITQDNYNPIIDKLLNQYNYIIYKQNSLQVDIAYLVKAYNILSGGISTFFSQILLLNDNLQILYMFHMNYKGELESKKYSVKIINKLIVFEIFAPKEYLASVYPWKNSDKQREFMINFIC